MSRIAFDRVYLVVLNINSCQKEPPEDRALVMMGESVSRAAFLFMLTSVQNHIRPVWSLDALNPGNVCDFVSTGVVLYEMKSDAGPIAVERAGIQYKVSNVVL